jgi:4'-phosphopantetheinyl transferase EntD
MSPAPELSALIRQVTLPGLAWGVARIGEAGGLYPEEAAHVARSRAPRRAEFAAGRLAARRALRALGRPACAIPAAPDRAPLWPEGLSGSISHAAGLAVAVLALRPDHPLLGLDIEAAEPLEPALIAEICRPEERAALPPGSEGLAARRVFSGKEALYKAHYPRHRVLFGFHALALNRSGTHAGFPPHPETATLPAEARRPMRLRQALGAGLILSLGLAGD